MSTPAPSLHAVPRTSPAPTLAARAAQRQAEAVSEGRAALAGFMATLEAAESEADAIAALEALPAGQREVARQLVRHLQHARTTLLSLQSRP